MKPYLWEYFGADTENVKPIYFEETKQGRFDIREFVNTQRKVTEYFEDKTTDPLDIEKPGCTDEPDFQCDPV